MKNLISILSVFSIMMSVNAFAAPKAKTANTGSSKTFSRPYGQAGCGLGSMIISKDSSQILAATTNETFDTQFFGITSGTSNCIDSPENEVAHKMDNFINANKNAIASDIARGQGETLSSLSEMLGCQDHVADLGSSLQRNFKVIFPSETVNANDVTDSIITVIKSDDSMTGKCGKVS